jgi:ABC-type branched-subunit amino acid transport system substrate-binding protein
MKKLLALSLLIMASFSALTAQNTTPKSVLFLIPFHTEAIGEINSAITSDADIYSILPFALVGFWKGTQLALADLEREEIPLNVIVRDVANDKDKLINLLSDENLMREVNVIIGPFYSEIFLLAKQYAQKYKIPIVNPFTTRQDILSENPYVYKLTPSEEARCQDLYERYGRDTNRYQIILWGNNDNLSDKQAVYQQFFKEHRVPVCNVAISADVTARFEPDKENVIVAFSCYTPLIMNAMRKLSGQQTGKSTLIIPEEWLALKEISPDYFNMLNVHFYSNYFVDYQNDKTQLFISDYIERFSSMPVLDRYSFQGYDVTNYFIRKFCFNQDVTNLVPLACKFDFAQQEGNGHENRLVRFCEVRDCAIMEVQDAITTPPTDTPATRPNRLKTGQY